MIRITIIDDNAERQGRLCAAMEATGQIEVVALFSSCRPVLTQLKETPTDLLLLPSVVGDRDTTESIESIMSNHPLPILVMSNRAYEPPKFVSHLLTLGVFEILSPPPDNNAAADAPYYRDLLSKIQSYAQTPVVTRRNRGFTRSDNKKTNKKDNRKDAPRRRSRPETRNARPRPTTEFVNPSANASAASSRCTDSQMILVGASTGGPPALESFLKQLPAPYPLPIAIVQHMSDGYTEGLASWLQESTGHQTVVCSDKQLLEPATVYFAAERTHLGLLSPSHIGPVTSQLDTPFKPAVDVLFASAAKYLKKHATAVIMTGMGKDGLRGMEQLYQEGGCTIAQHPDTCVVSSMPLSVIEAGFAKHIMTIDDICQFLRAVGPK